MYRTDCRVCGIYAHSYLHAEPVCYECKHNWYKGIRRMMQYKNQVASAVTHAIGTAWVIKNERGA